MNEPTVQTVDLATGEITQAPAVKTLEERLIEQEQIVLKAQVEIDTSMKSLYEMRAAAEVLIKAAQAAVEARDRALIKIEDEGLWMAGNHYETPDDYFDAKGFSRQRAKQIRDRVKLALLVNTVDASLPIPSDPIARWLSQLSDEEKVKVWRLAVEEADGPAPVKRVRLLTEASLDGVDVENGQALALYEGNRMVENIMSIAKRLGKDRLNDLIDRLAELTETGPAKAKLYDNEKFVGMVDVGDIHIEGYEDTMTYAGDPHAAGVSLKHMEQIVKNFKQKPINMDDFDDMSPNNP